MHPPIHSGGPALPRRRGSSHATVWHRAIACSCALAVGGALPHGIRAQSAPDRVLVRTRDAGPSGTLPVDRGLSGLGHRLQKLLTTGSVLYTAGHPDDEESGVVTLLGRGTGARTALLTLNRGEGGANAIGPELFDGLGLIRSEELRLAGRYYGLDDQYFTTAVDYGYSKTLEEALRSWDRDRLLGDMVRVIRINRPTIVISRWHGSERDGHGHHQAAGVLTAEAVRAAADPGRYPEQITREGLRPWRVTRLFRGRLRDEEPHDAELDPHAIDPWLGESYRDFGAYGLSLQRSQTSGRIRSAPWPFRPARYQSLPTAEDPSTGRSPGTALATSVFAGLDTSLTGVGTLAGESLPPDAGSALDEAEAAVERALSELGPSTLDRVVGHVADALAAIRRASANVDPDSEVGFVLAIKERQAADVLADAAGLTLRAIASPAGAAPDTPMGPAVPGQSLDIRVGLSARESSEARLVSVELAARGGWPSSPAAPQGGPILIGRYATETISTRIPGDAQPSRPWFYRTDIRQNHYMVRDSSELHLGESRPEAEVVATIEVGGQRLEVREPVRRLEADAPYGRLLRPLEVAPIVSVSAQPRIALSDADGSFDVLVTVTSHAIRPVAAFASLELPAGWSSDPDAAELSFEVAGQTESVPFRVHAPGGGEGPTSVEAGSGTRHVDAWVRVDDRTYREGYELVAHRDLGSRRLWSPARVTVPAVRARVSEGVRVGYVMGVGDEVPEAIRQLGATVSLIDPIELEGGELGVYDAIVIGTRAYAIRRDLIASNPRVLDFARSGGHLIVLYQTPEYDPATQAPVPATLPPNAEEVSEENAPVRLLEPDHPLLSRPYRIDSRDFEGWVEQRGSKFFSSWDPAYTALIETHDRGQSPQQGIWLTAPVGDGRFTYVALALHRQLPYGVPGAYRILANLLTVGR